MRNLTRVLLFAAACSLAVAACSSGGSDPNSSGRTSQATEELRDYGLTKAQASCIVKALGADTVVEAADVATLVDGQAYKDAAKTCVDGG